MKKSPIFLNIVLLLIAAFFAFGSVWNFKKWTTLSKEAFNTRVEAVTSTRKQPLVIAPQPARVPATSESTTTSLRESVAPSPVPIPDTFQLSVPFTSQAPEKNWNQPWQDACEEAVLLMLDAYYKGYSLSPLFARDELLKILAYEDTLGYGGSIEIEKIKQVGMDTLHLEKHGKPTIVQHPTAEDIKRYIAAGKPVLVVADGKILPNPHFTNGGPEYHALIVTGYTADTFITNDPGTQFGEHFVYQIDELMNAIRDWNGGNVKEGRRVIMVIE